MACDRDDAAFMCVLAVARVAAPASRIRITSPTPRTATLRALVSPFAETLQGQGQGQGSE
jgi:hypothetical protein